MTPDIEKGPEEFQRLPAHGEGALELHPAQTGRSAEKIEEDGLGVVVRVVSKEDSWTAMAARTVSKKLVPRPPRRNLEGRFFFPCPSLHVGARDLER